MDGGRFLVSLGLAALLAIGCSDSEDVEADPLDDFPLCAADRTCEAGSRCVEATDSELQPIFICAPFCGTECDYCVCESETAADCQPGIGCIEPGPVGAPCERDTDCESANCSEREQVCRVSVGQDCTEANCDRCLVHENGWSYCSRDCTGDGHDVCNGGFCLGTTSAFNPDSGLLTCRPPCDVDCPTQCDGFGGGQFCECEPNDDGCSLLNPPLSDGEICRADVSCESRECYNQVFCGGDAACSGREGVCTQSCSGSGSCIAGYRCVGVICDVNGVTGCAQRRCLPVCDESNACPVGTCQLRRPTEGDDLMVCDVR